jgi:hypothetical protein
MRRWAVLIAIALLPHAAGAACINRFVVRQESSGHWLITLLTGHLTFQEAQTLSKAIAAKQSPLIEWVDDKGRMLARQLGDLKVVRPMPVACDPKPSGVIMTMLVLAPRPPEVKMRVKFDAKTIFDFDEQKE